ncbi:hypothetical protein Leryth_000010 [Lithospermum erythrorhizon]|nr:hypothetical protein Leryth_000010 [Lithospermum erythrorhizon]
MGSLERIMVEPERPQDDDDADDEGPPPGFSSIQEPPIMHEEQPSMHQVQPTVQKVLQTVVQDDDDDDDDEVKGPPPGFSTPPALSLEENDMDEENPPGGLYSRCTPELSTPPKTPLATSISSDVKENSNRDDIEEEDDGPPPGWHLIPPQQCQPPKVSTSSPLSAISADVEMDSRMKDTRNESSILPCRSEPAIGQNLSSSASLPKAPQSADTFETGFHQGGHNFAENNGHQSKRQTVSPSQKPTSMQVSPSACITPSESEMGQLVCGTCRQLLSYPRGAKYVKCAKCQEVNLVLEEHEVGQVKCGGCLVLLMYRYGSPAVRCSSCRFVTSIGAHNRRPPLSEQQAQAHCRPRAARIR